MTTGLGKYADYLDIIATFSRFASGIDRRDWELYRSVFTDEIDVDYTSYRPGSKSRMAADLWVDRAKGLFPGLDASQHSLSNPAIEIDGDTASATMYLVAEHFLTNDQGDNSYTIGGYYSDSLVREDGVWRISAKRLTVTWNRGNRHVLTLAAARAAERAAG